MSTPYERACTLHDHISEAILRSSLPPGDVLPVLAQILGYIVSMQDRAVYTPEQVMARVQEHFAAGNQFKANAGVPQ
jgi:hypothetical protein